MRTRRRNAIATLVHAAQLTILIAMDPSLFPPPPAEHVDRSGWLDTCVALTLERFRAVRMRSVLLAWIRFLTFMGIPAGIYYALVHQAGGGAIIAIAALLFFCLAIRIHTRVRNQALMIRLLRDILDESIRRIGGEPVIIRAGKEPPERSIWKTLFESMDGTDSCHELTDQESGDLDVFNEALSLFGLLNRASTPVGECRLAHVLTRPLLSVDAILDRQAAAHWMVRHPVARLRLMAAAAGMRTMGDACRGLYRTIRDAEPMPSRAAMGWLRVWGLAGPITLALGIADQAGWFPFGPGYLPFAGVAMINVVMIQLVLKPLRERIRPWLHLDEIVPRLRFFAESAVSILPEDGLLGRQRVKLEAALGHACLPALQHRIPLLFLGLSGLMHTIIDVLVFWDLQALWLLEKCTIDHRAPLLDSFAALAECELITSLGAFAWEQPETVWPEFVSDGRQLEIDRGRHPLIPPAESVANSLKLGGDVRTWIITGSNMSGKSTFLRMTATNVLLAQIGSAVTASRHVLSPLEIMTDLRIRDELSKKESYFLAEVRQVRRMVRAAQSDRPAFILIDEPFRGTNSAERVAAASAVIATLIEGAGVHLVATHDAALTSLGVSPHAANHHFREGFDQDRLVFDYALRPGPAESRNALRVLESEHYPPELVDYARRLLPSPDRPPGGGESV